ncbi:MAG: 5-bromo-4-chloroindolyl phosphate hydrolysis family protein [Lachnotalea sp.]
MGKRNFSNLEDEIKDIVQNAINTMDFYQLNKNIENTVGNAMSEVRNALGANRNHRQSEQSLHNTGHAHTRRDERSNRPHHTHDVSSNYKNYNVSTRKLTTAYPTLPVGKVSGVLCTVFGWIFLPITSISILVLSLIGFILHNMSLFGSIAVAILPFLLISLLLTINGSRIRARLRRFYRYISLFKNQGYYSIHDLSSQTNLSNKFIKKDLRKMIDLGMFPEGHVDEQATCIILNQESYEQYLQLQKNAAMQKANDNAHSATPTHSDEAAPTQSKTQAPINDELQSAIANGRYCIRQIKEANDAILGEEISMKLDRLEMVVDKIFTHVEQHPNQLLEINKFMDYYLPTTLKLVSAYKEFDNQSVQGENIRCAKREIETTLNTINHAFETLLDSLFEDAAMDISTDISVLETMLAQEGLTKNNFKPNGSVGGNNHDE